MGSKFHSELHTREGVTYLKLSGVIDEDNDLAGLEGRIAPGTLVIHLGEIDRINSCGVRDWVNWLGRLEKAGSRPVLVECAPPIVSQINLVHNFTGGGVVKSFYAPYFCASCQREKLLLLETREVAASGPPFVAPTCRCDECDGPMEFDDMEESYFAFLNNAKKVATDPSVDAVVQEFATVEPTGSGSGGKLRPRGSTGSPSASSPPTPQPAAPAERVGPLPSVPVVPAAPPRPSSGLPPSATSGLGHGGPPSSGMMAAPSMPALTPPPPGEDRFAPRNITTSPGTPAAIASQLAHEAQAQARRAALQAEAKSPLAWGLLIMLLLLAAGLLAWVFVT